MSIFHSLFCSRKVRREGRGRVRREREEDAVEAFIRAGISVPHSLFRSRKVKRKGGERRGEEGRRRKWRHSLGLE